MVVRKKEIAQRWKIDTIWYEMLPADNNNRWNLKKRL